MGQEADLVVFPETWLPGYPVWLDASPEAALWNSPPARVLYRLLADNSLTIPGKHLDTLLEIARTTDTYVVMGAHERLAGTLYNTMVFIHKDGEQFKIHRKLVPTYTERLVWGRGDGSTLSVLETEWGSLGGLICWEHWMPLARAAMHAKKETVHVAQWPWVRGLHQLASRHYAFEGQCFVIAAGCVLSKGDAIEGFLSLVRNEAGALDLLRALPGENEDLLMKGGSAVIGPDYSYVVEPLWEERGMICAELDLDLITEGHLLLDTDGHYSRPDVFRLEVNEEPSSNVTFTSHAG
ncbi:MAG TPA: carbon-nitrogen hydrolase family protein [Chloroflexi bacterium]|nr:carbon-nitrogen hydrolase family protein [Chloroflexota bacterium]